MIIIAWALQAATLGGALAFLITYLVTVVRGSTPLRTPAERSARALLLSLPVALVALLLPGTIYLLAAGDHTPASFTNVGNVFGKAVALALLWFPWRLYWRARKARP